MLSINLIVFVFLNFHFTQPLRLESIEKIDLKDVSIEYFSRILEVCVEFYGSIPF